MSEPRHGCGYELRRSRPAPLGSRSRRLTDPGALDGTPLGYLRGSWAGTGLHLGSAFQTRSEGRPIARLARETITFARLALPRGAGSGDTSEETLPGVHYVRCAEEQLSGEPLDAESGSWLAPAEHADPPDPFGMLHLSSAPGAEPLVALGCARPHRGPPALPTLRQRSRGALQDMPYATPPAGIDLAEIEDPHLFLRRDAEGVTVVETIHFSATTAAGEEFARRVRANGFTAGGSRWANIEVDLWLQRIAAGAAVSYDVLQISRRLTRLPERDSPPYVSVATVYRIPGESGA